MAEDIYIVAETEDWSAEERNAALKAVAWLDGEYSLLSEEW